MRIGISLLNLRPGKVGGIETYIRKVVEYAPQVAEDDEFIFFVHRDNRDVVPDSQRVILVDHSQRTIDLFRILEAFTPWRARSIERVMEASGVEVMFYPQQTLFPIECHLRSVLFVADVQYLFFPHYFSWVDLRFRRRAYLRSLQRASCLTTVSQSTATHVAERCGVDSRKIKVIHHGFDPLSPPPPGPIAVRPYSYLYYPAASYPHKGHAQLFRTYAALARSGRLKPRLLLSGERNAHWATLAEVIRQEAMEERIVHLGYLSYADVLSLYQKAEAIVFPTEFEGFGLPVLEAVQLKKKIVCSRLTVFDEVGVPREWQIDFADPEQFLTALNQTGPTRLLKEPISWREAIRQTVELLRTGEIE